MRSAKRFYRLNLALAALAVGSLASIAVVALTRFDLRLPSEAALLATCRSVIPLQSSVALIAVLALTAFGLVAVSVAIRSLWRQLRDQRRFLAGVRPLNEVQLRGGTAVLIADERPRAFCAGLIRPRVYVSTAALRLLSTSELRAVVAHEAHHRGRHDPLRILIVRALADALFFLPGLRRLSERYRELAELAADEAAAAAEGSDALASALLAFGQRDGPAAAVVGIAPERVDHLLGEPPRWGVSPAVLGGALIGVVGLLAVAAFVAIFVQAGSLSLASLLAEICMLGMFAAPLALVAVAVAVSCRRAQRA